MRNRIRYFDHTPTWQIAAIFIIILLATWLRVWKLPSHTIFFGDAGRDFVVAQSALESKTLPLLGIASSVPRFKQGPINVWWVMLFQAVGINDPGIVTYSYALIGVMTIIALYELLATQFPKQPQIALVASAIVAASPLAVAQSRMPFHTSWIPLATVFFIYAGTRFWQQKPHAWWLFFFSWAVMFQFELATAPLILVIGYGIWKQGRLPSRKNLLEATAGLTVGLLPQIIFDLTHRFQQLGIFVIWVGYRLASFIYPLSDHAASPNHLTGGLQQFTLYWGRIASVDSVISQAVFLSLLVIAMITIGKMTSRKKFVLPPLVEVAVLSTGALIASYLVHGSPSEAYFPPFIILLAVLIGYGLAPHWKGRSGGVLGLSMLIWMFVNIWQVADSQWFLNQTYQFNYGASLGEQKAVMRFILADSQGAYHLASTQPGNHFEHYLSNYRWLGRMARQPSSEGTVYWIEQGQSSLESYPSIVQFGFDTVNVFRAPKSNSNTFENL